MKNEKQNIEWELDELGTFLAQLLEYHLSPKNNCS